MRARHSELSQALQYHFNDQGLLYRALNHRSASGQSNERLEFLGDGVLNFVIGEILYHRYPQASEGELSRLRASLVKGDTLAELARSLSLGNYIRLGPGERKSGGFRRTSILANTLEALFGAVLLDGGFKTCYELILRLFEQRLRNLPQATELKDPKTQLQEYLQAEQRALPVYEIIKISGADHQQNFTVECTLDTLSTKATASSRRKAEQAAARKALDMLT